MKQYLTNLIAFFAGFAKLQTLTYDPGWGVVGPKPFALLYAVDYGTHVLSGGAVVSWSRWAHDNPKLGLAVWLNRLLGPKHTSEAGPTLWGTVDCPWPVRVGVSIFWLLVLLVVS